jgi:hypothetical protein
MALAGNLYRDSAGVLHSDVVGYGIYINNAQYQQYIIYGDKDGNKIYNAGDYVIETVNFGQNQYDFFFIGAAFGAYASINYAFPNASLTSYNAIGLDLGSNVLGVQVNFFKDGVAAKTVIMYRTGLVEIR